MRTLCIPLLAIGALNAQITRQPEFDQRDKFRASQVDMAIDSDSHTSGMRGARVNALLNRYLQTPWEGSSKLDEVRAHLKRQDYTAASAALAGAAPKPVFEIARAVTLAGLGDPHGAAAPLCSALGQDSKVALPFVADLLELNPGEAGCLRRYLANAALKSPRDSHVLYVYALSLLRAEPPDPAAAEAALVKASQAGPKSSQVWFELGKLQSTPGREAEAVASFERAVEIDPGLAQAHYRLAQLYRQGGKPDQAASHLEAWRKTKDSR